MKSPRGEAPARYGGALTHRRKVLFLAGGVRDSHDQHVLCEPALLAAHHGRDTERVALLAEEGISAVPAAIAPDLLGAREVANVLVCAGGRAAKKCT